MPVDHYILPRVHNILSLYYELLILRILCKPKCIARTEDGLCHQEIGSVWNLRIIASYIDQMMLEHGRTNIFLCLHLLSYNCCF